MSEWISIKDRMPEINHIVALAHNDRWMNSPAHEEEGLNWYGAGYLAQHGNQFWNIIGETRSQCLDAVTHWMPFPALPREGQP